MPLSHNGIGAVLVLTLLSPALAHASDSVTYFTFSKPVQIPGATLPAGKYRFRVLDSDSGRNAVYVSSEDGKKRYALFLTMRGMYRKEAENESLIAFRETRSGRPQAIRGWFYPGETSGYEFVYSKKQARDISGRTHQ